MTKKWKRSYKFPARSRKEMVAYICDRQAYYDYGLAYPFAWNVKAYHVNYRRPKGEGNLNPALDTKWEDYLENNPDAGEWAFEDAQRNLSEGEYTTYHGDDQGDWEFDFAGRQGGHLCLIKWCDRDMTRFTLLDELLILENDGGWSFASVQTLYRALVTMDSDFTPEKASAEVEYCLNYIRGEWEREQDAELEFEAREIEATRPDLYMEGVR